MPAPTSTLDFLSLARRSGLVDPERLEALAGESADATPKQLAARLIAAGLVTRFQAEQLLLGKWRGFSIGKYRVLERLGVGGNGSVYLCEHALVRRKVAIKVLPAAKADSPSALARFYREARAAGSLDHPHLLKAHDIDQENGLHFLVMDYVDGTSLQDLVARGGPLAPPRAAHYLAQAARGLQAAHDAGLVHRDVKPANLLLDRGGIVRVADLGLARFFSDHADPLTLRYDENNVLGTADYVAPEQALNSHEVDGRADVYSLGCTFYFLLTGQPPFQGGKVAQKLIWHQVKEPTPVRQLRPEVPEEMAVVVARMLAKDPAGRYQTPGEVAEALAPWADSLPYPPAESELPKLSPAARSSSGGDSASGKSTMRRAADGLATLPVDIGSNPSSNLSRTDPCPAPPPATDPVAPAASPLPEKADWQPAPPAPAPQAPLAPMVRDKGNPGRAAQGLRLAFILLAGMAAGSALRWFAGHPTAAGAAAAASSSAGHTAEDNRP
jgi:serine/threonine protein kinase